MPIRPQKIAVLRADLKKYIYSQEALNKVFFWPNTNGKVRGDPCKKEHMPEAVPRWVHLKARLLTKQLA